MLAAAAGGRFRQQFARAGNHRYAVDPGVIVIGGGL